MANGNGYIPYLSPPWPHITFPLPNGGPVRNPGESDASYDQRINAWLKAGGLGNTDHGGELFPPIDPPSSIGPIPNPVAHINSVADFLKALANGQTWVRVGEVAVGLILLAVGVDHMMGTNYTGKAAKAATKAAVL